MTIFGLSNTKNCRTCKKKIALSDDLFPQCHGLPDGRPPKGRHQPHGGIVTRLFGFVKGKVTIAKLVATVSGCWGLPGLPGGSCPGWREHLPPLLVSCALRPATETEQSRRATAKRGQPPTSLTPPGAPSGGGGAGGRRGEASGRKRQRRRQEGSRAGGGNKTGGEQAYGTEGPERGSPPAPSPAEPGGGTSCDNHPARPGGGAPLGGGGPKEPTGGRPGPEAPGATAPGAGVANKGRIPQLGGGPAE